MKTLFILTSLFGNLDFVTAIFSRNPEFLSKTDSLDQDGRTPFELAALNEQIDLLTYLLQENPLLAKMSDSDSRKCTILHLSTGHNSIGYEYDHNSLLLCFLFFITILVFVLDLFNLIKNMIVNTK